MCQILLSINPEHVKNIFNGTKKYEYRKIECKKKVDKIIIYCTSPVMRVVGEARVDEVLVDTPKTIWQETNEKSGIKKDFFDKYFNNRKKAIAFKLIEVIPYEEPRNLSDYGITYAPQSFVYITEQVAV